MQHCYNFTTGTTYIKQLLAESVTIKGLILSDNPIGDKGLENLAEGLQDNTILTDLKVWRCNLSSEGIILLCNVMSL